MKPEMKNNILLKSALALAIVDLVLITAILVQVNNLVKDVVELQNKQLEIGVMRERLEKAEGVKEPEIKPEGKEISDKEFSITDNPQKAGWKIYSNRKYNYQIEFPDDWVIADARVSNLHLTKGKNSFLIEVPPLGYGRNVSKKGVEITFNNIFAEKIEGDNSIIVNFDRDRTKLALKNNEGLIRFVYDTQNKEENIKIFNQILSTLRFID